MIIAKTLVVQCIAILDFVCMHRFPGCEKSGFKYPISEAAMKLREAVAYLDKKSRA